MTPIELCKRAFEAIHLSDVFDVVLYMILYMISREIANLSTRQVWEERDCKQSVRG